MKILTVILFGLTASIAACGCGSDEKTSETHAEPISLLVCDGNSLTYGQYSADPENLSYPGLLRAEGRNTVNLAIPGQTSEAMLENAPEKVDSLFVQNAAVVFWEGINSYAVKEYSGEEGYAVLTQYIEGRAAKGFRTIVMTMLPSGHPSHINIGMGAFRLRYNELIRENAAGADLVIDLSLDERLENPMDASYFQERDRVHLTDAGNQVVFESVSKALKEKEATK